MSLSEVKEVLATTEPLGQHTFHTLGQEAPKFTLNKGWNTGVKAMNGMDTVDATVEIGGESYTLTKDSLLEATTLIGITKSYAMRTPADLIESHLNYWMSSDDKEFKALTGGSTVLAFTKGTIVPFSNLKLVEAVADQMAQTAKVSESDIWVDYKLHHSLRYTRVRLIIPEAAREIRGTNWSTGIQVQNSLVGEKPTSARGYMFTWDCTNGQISTHAQSGNWNRRTGGQGEDVYEWARDAVDGILEGLEHELDAVQEIGDEVLDRSLPDVIDDVFQTYAVPVEARNAIIQRLVEKNLEDLTMYDVMYAVTEVANGIDVSESVRNALMEVGGDLPRAHSHRCVNCHRISL